jgi:hypothetical protein
MLQVQAQTDLREMLLMTTARQGQVADWQVANTQTAIERLFTSKLSQLVIPELMLNLVRAAACRADVGSAATRGLWRSRHQHGGHTDAERAAANRGRASGARRSREARPRASHPPSCAAAARAPASAHAGAI